MITIRRFSPEDEKSVLHLITSIMNEEFKDEKDAYPPADIENIRANYGNLGEAFFVAADKDKIIGTVGIKKEDSRVALMRRLFVSPEYRGRKIGMKLIERVVQFCQEVGYQEIVFKTTSRMAGANEVCQKAGFIQRAKLALGAVELLKFAFSIRDGKVLAKS